MSHKMHKSLRKGFTKQEIKADLKEGYLVVSAQKPEEEQSVDIKYVRRERYQSQCSRKYFVGNQVTKEDIRARFEDGVLYITIPKKADVKKEDDDSIIID